MKKKPITTEVTRNIRQHTAELTNLLQTENWHMGAMIEWGLEMGTKEKEGKGEEEGA